MGMMSSLTPSLSLSPSLILTLTQGFSSVQDIKRKVDNKTANAGPAPERCWVLTPLGGFAGASSHSEAQDLNRTRQPWDTPGASWGSGSSPRHWDGAGGLCAKCHWQTCRVCGNSVLWKEWGSRQAERGS